jgi:transcriptional regulator with XRE-family HTH domain
MNAERHPAGAIFARRLREIREDRRPRMTQADLARRVLEVMGVPTDDPKRVEVVRVMVSRTESGARTATVDDLVLFAQALEVPPGALLEGSGGIDSLSDLEERMVNMLEQLRAAKPEALTDSLHARAEAALEPKPKERKP